jgi:enoyl-CoA hydratase/carnithine racemase
MWQEAIDALEQANAAPETRVILIRSAGGSVFSGGADLDELAELGLAADGEARAQQLLEEVERFLSAIEKSPKLVVAVIEGAAIGAGLEIAAACDMRIASERARFGIPAAKHGIVIARPDVSRLARIVGWAFASELLLTARTIDAEEALRRGLASRVVADKTLQATIDALVERVANLSADSIAAMKAHLHASWPAAGADEEGFAASRAALASVELHSALAGRRRQSSRSGEDDDSN